MQLFDVSGVEGKIGYTFNDKMLLRRAFTHSSFAHEHHQEDNEKLEFFGDSVLQFVVTEYLCKKYNSKEGALTQMRAKIVSKFPLIEAIKELKLNQDILMGNGAKKMAREDDKLYSSVYEALVAAIYLDGGLSKARKFILNTVIKDYEETERQAKAGSVKAIAKSQFQEFVQKRNLGNIEYRVLKQDGPPHNIEFTVGLYLDGKKISTGKGFSKKNAEALCAMQALKKLTAKKDGK